MSREPGAPAAAWEPNGVGVSLSKSSLDILYLLSPKKVHNHLGVTEEAQSITSCRDLWIHVEVDGHPSRNHG